MVNIAIATGKDSLNKTIRENLNSLSQCQSIIIRDLFYLIKNKFDIIIISIDLLNKGDIENVLNELNKKSRIVFLTYEDNQEEIEMCNKNGVENIIFNPITTEKIISIISNACEKNKFLNTFQVDKENFNNEKSNDFYIAEEIVVNNEEVINNHKTIEIREEKDSIKNLEKNQKNIVHHISKKKNKNIIKAKYENYNIEEKEKIITVVKNNIIGTIVIAVAGAMERIGTTHTTLSIANYLKEKGFKVGVVELNASKSFEHIKNSYSNIIENEDSFIINKIKFFSYSKDLNISYINYNEFNYLILDMGIYDDCILDEFKRANLKILVSGSKEWEVECLENILRESEDIFYIKYLFNFTDNNLFKEICSNMIDLECYKTPMNPNPFCLTEDANEIYTKILKNILPECGRKRKSLFKFI